MTNQQLYLAIGIPSFLVILAWVTNFMQNNRLETKITETNTKLDALRGEVFTKFDALRAEMFSEFKEFYRTLGQHDGAIEALKKEGK